MIGRAIPRKHLGIVGILCKTSTAKHRVSGDVGAGMIDVILRTGLTVSLLTAPTAQAADVDAFLAGSERACLACDLAGRDLSDRDLKRVRLDRADLKKA